MQALSATVKMDYDTYYIEYFPNNIYNNRFAVFSNRRSAVYVYSIQDAMNQIEHYNDLDIEQACLTSELEYNQ